ATARLGDCMSEPDSPPRRRPPTIDLTATEVEKPAAAQEPSPEPATEPAAADALGSSGQQTDKPAPSRPRSSVKTAVAGIAVGAIAVVAIGAGLWFGGYVPPGLLPVSPNAQPPNSSAIAEIS